MTDKMTVFLEVLSAILLAAKLIGMTNMSTIKCLIPLIMAGVVQFISIVIIERLSDDEVNDEES